MAEFNMDMMMGEQDGSTSHNSDEFLDVSNNYGAAGAGMGFQNFDDKFQEIIDNEEVEDVVDLNERFLSQQLGIEQDELSLITKIELRVDTSCHNLQITGEILSSLQ